MKINEYIQYIQGHKDSKGDVAPWVIRSHGTKKILKSFSTQKKAKEALRIMSMYKETTMRYKISLVEESNINNNFYNWFNGSKVVDDNGKPLKVYHGTRRPDRVQNKFNPKRATSGPMAYFSNSPSVASGYAVSKRDTSIEEEEEYASRFLVSIKGLKNPRSIIEYWYYADFDTKENIKKVAPFISEEDGKIYYNSSKKRGLASLDTFMYFVRKKHGNYLAALAEVWLQSGTLFNKEEQFMEVLAFLNLPITVMYSDPNEQYPGVYPVYLRIINPLYSNNIPNSVMDALKQASKYQKTKYSQEMDFWNKHFMDPKVWIQSLINYEDFVWTSIPDWVTKVLKKLGYDGIIDLERSSSSSQTGVQNVYIPFKPNQVKSVYNIGTWSLDSNKINENKKQKEYKLREITYQDIFDPSFKKFIKE